MKHLPFELLQDLQIKHSLLSVQEEKTRVIPPEIPKNGELPGLEKKMVLVSPFAFSFGKSLGDWLHSKGYGIDPKTTQRLLEQKSVSAFISQLETVLKQKIPQPLQFEILRQAVDANGLRSYWSALRIISFHSFKSRKIIRKGAEIIPIKTKRQFEYHFHSQTDPEQVDRQDYHRAEAENTEAAFLCFEGAEKQTFETFYDYVWRRIQGKLDRQIKRNETPPLWVWRKRFKDELTVFFKAKVGGNGYASDFQDSKVRDLQRQGKKIKGLTAVALVKKAFTEAIDSNEFSHQEYTCMIARNRGYSHLAISRFTGFKSQDVISMLEKAVPKAARIIYGVFCEKMGDPETEHGLAVTEKLVREILLSKTEKV